MRKRIKKQKDTNFLSIHRGGDKIIFTVVFIIFALHCVSLIFPVAWMFMSSFKDSTEYFIGDSFAFPEIWLWENYIDAFVLLNVGKTNFAGMVFNSIWYTAITTGMSVIMPAITGYVLSKYDFPGRNLIYTVAIFALTIPIVGSTAAGLKLIASMNLLDNPLYLVVAGLGGFGGSFLVYYGFFKSVSWSYAEAAEIDGANAFVIFFKIMLPQALPIMGTYAITGAIANWNAYEPNILYLPSYPTLAYGLFAYKSNAARTNFPVYYAGLIIAMIPTIVLFSIFSDKIMSSLSVGGLKG